MVINSGTDSNIIKFKIIKLLFSNKSIDMYRVKFLNCFRRVAQESEEFRAYIIIKKDTWMRYINVLI